MKNIIKKYGIFAFMGLLAFTLSGSVGYYGYTKHQEQQDKIEHLTSLVDILGNVVEQRTNLLLRNDHVLAEEVAKLRGHQL